MQVHAARDLVVDAPTRACRILDTLEDDLQDCRSELRRLVDQLRPPALDHGLHASLQSDCQRFTSANLRVVLSVDGDMRDLPAAVEVAAYRIVAEALTNVVRHARARNCRVAVHRADASLLLEIADDGIGVSRHEGSGVGLISMRERAAELNGDCVIGPADPHGTAIVVRLPFRATSVLPRTTTPLAGSGLTAGLR
jgi:two-component system NarL family sensor kinase